MGPTGEQFRVLQVHPTRFCNLTCRHCYSSSGPDQRQELPPQLLLDALDDAAAEGYNDVGFSGGEPVLYPDLGRLLRHAKGIGMLTSVTSNGMLLEGKRLEMLVGGTDLLAISLDGVPSSHNLIRNSSQAFDRMSANLEGVRQTGIPFGFIFTLTLTNLHELKWVAQFAIEQGASLLQIHPLESVGRAEGSMPGKTPDDVEAAYAYLEAVRLQAAVGTKLTVKVDLVDREALRPTPDRVYAGGCGIDANDRPLADLASPLVVEQDGAVVPLTYGFSRRYAVGNLHEARLRDMVDPWKEAVMPGFRELCSRVYDDVLRTDDLPMFNWYESISRASHGAPAEGVFAA